MPEPIEEALGFDISGALQGIGQIDDALTQVTQQFSVGLATALETLTSIGANVPPLAESLDVAGLGPAIDTALANANAVVPVEADTSAAVNQIDQLSLGLTETIPIEADTAPAEEQIGQLGLGLTVDVPINADTSEAQTAIDALNTAPVTVDVNADTSQAQEQLDALGTSATGATGGGQTGLAGLEGAVLGVKAATGAAEGDVAGLTGAFGALGGEASAGGAAVLAFGGFIAETTKLAADAEAQQRRFNDTFGASAAIVQNIDVGGLNISLEELGKQSGTTVANLEASATRVGLLGNAAKAAKPEIAGTAADLLGLAGAIAVANPRFGDTATVADTVSRALSTGRTRSLIPYGISLTTTAIQQEAFNQTQKTSADQLTGYDKLVAGLTLALQQQGDTLGGTFRRGAENAQIQLRSLKTQLEETLVSVGGPLLKPLIDTLTELTPVAQATAQILGGFARLTFPWVVVLARDIGALTPALTLVADLLNKIADAENSLIGPTQQLQSGVGGVGAAASTAGGHFDTLANAAFGLVPGLGEGVRSMRLLGDVTGLFGDKSKQAAVDFSNLSTQLQTAGTLGSGGIGKLGPAIDDLAKHFTSGSEQAKAFNETLVGLASSGKTDEAERALGLVSKELEKQGKSASEIGALFKPYFDALSATAELNKAAATEINKVGITATASTGGFLQLSTAIDANKVSASDAAAVAEQLGIKTDDATTIIKDQVAAITDQKDKQIEATGAARDLFSQLERGTISASDAQIAFLNLGISVGGTAQLLTAGAAAAKEHDQANTVLGLSTGRLQQAFLDLKPAIADGTITAGDAQFVAQDLGISFDDAKAAIDSLSTAMDQFVSQGLSALPSAGQAISDFASGIQSAQSNLDSVLSSSASSTSGVDAVARAQESANRAISDGAEKRARTVAAAEQKVRDAQAALDQAEQSSSTHRVAQIASAQRTLETAQAGLVSAQEKAGQAQADAVRSGSRKVSDAQNAANQKSADEAKKVRDAQAALIAAQDPQRVIDAENAQIFRILSFQQNLAVLLRRGRDQVVAQLVAEGPEKGAALASSLVNDDAKAKALDSGLALGQKIREGYAGFLQNPKVKAELSGFAVTLADGSTKTLGEVLRTSGEKAAGSLLNGLTGGFTHATGLTSTAHTGAAVLGSAIDTATAGAKKKGEDAGTAAQTGFTTSFTPETSAATAIAKVPAAIAGGIAPINIAATTAGDAVAARFHPNFAAQILPAMLQVVSSIATGVAQVAPFVGEEGAVLGTAFGQGFAGGLTLAGPDVTFAAGALADEAVAAIRKALGIKSPSSVGVDIGTQFVAGVAQGLSELSPLHQATAALALALIPDIRPALRQIPSLAPAITSAGQQIVSRPVVVAAPASTQPSTPPGKNVNVRVDLHKVDVNPKHLADEIAWTIG